jgi:hypothetical protein
VVEEVEDLLDQVVQEAEEQVVIEHPSQEEQKFHYNQDQLQLQLEEEEMVEMDQFHLVLVVEDQMVILQYFQQSLQQVEEVVEIIQVLIKMVFQEDQVEDLVMDLQQVDQEILPQ